MRNTLAALRKGCILLLLMFVGAWADGDDSSDLYLTFGQSTMNDTSPYPYHKSISVWYESFLKVAVRALAPSLNQRF